MDQNKGKHQEKPFPFNIRNWLPNIDQNEIKSKLKNPNKLIRVINYNLLCDSLLPASTHIKEHELSKLPYLNWEIRREKILSELNEINGDLIGFEEIERDEKFIENFIKNDYDFIFKPRTGNHSEGCAFAFKKSKFNLIEIYGLNFNMNINNDTNKNMSEIFNRDNISIIGVLNLIDDNNTIIIFSVTHLLFNKNRGDIKLGQIYQLFQGINLLKEKYEKDNKSVYIFLTSDLNSIPKSGVYKLITQGELNCNFINHYDVSGQDPNNLQYVKTPEKIRAFLLKQITTTFKGEKPKKDSYKNNYYNQNENNLPLDQNIKWYNEICRIHPVINEKKEMNLEYNNSYKYKDYDLILKLPFLMNSAYSKMAISIRDFLSNPQSDLSKKIPFNLLKDIKELDNIEVNGVKMGVKEIKKTIEFSKNLTMDLPFTVYSSNTIMTLDYIFFSSSKNDISVVRILSHPDIFKIVFDIGFMPNNIFPSDHFSIAADFIIENDK